MGRRDAADNFSLAKIPPFDLTARVITKRKKVPKHPEFKDDDLLPAGFMNPDSSARWMLRRPEVEPLVLALLQRVVRLALPQQFMFCMPDFEKWYEKHGRHGENELAKMVFKQSLCPNCLESTTVRKTQKGTASKITLRRAPCQPRG
jgi:hypothetical protein